MCRRCSKRASCFHQIASQAVACLRIHVQHAQAGIEAEGSSSEPCFGFEQSIEIIQDLRLEDSRQGAAIRSAVRLALRSYANDRGPVLMGIFLPSTAGVRYFPLAHPDSFAS